MNEKLFESNIDIEIEEEATPEAQRSSWKQTNKNKIIIPKLWSGHAPSAYILRF
jgi:hypothetical protein